MHANRRNPAPAFRSKHLTTFRQIGMRRDELLGICRDRELNLRARVGPIFAPEEKKGRPREAMRECRGETGGKRPTVPTNGW